MFPEIGISGRHHWLDGLIEMGFLFHSYQYINNRLGAQAWYEVLPICSTTGESWVNAASMIDFSCWNLSTHPGWYDSMVIFMAICI